MLALVKAGALLGDKGYNADSFIQHQLAVAIKAVIPPSVNRKVKRTAISRSIANEFPSSNSLCIIKHFRGIATRCEKTVGNLFVGLPLVCAIVYLK